MKGALEHVSLSFFYLFVTVRSHAMQVMASGWGDAIRK